MQYFDGNKDKKLTWSALLFGDDKGLMGGGKADSTDDACHRQKELFSELYSWFYEFSINRSSRT
jgi:hypothetical protein